MRRAKDEVAIAVEEFHRRVRRAVQGHLAQRGVTRDDLAAFLEVEDAHVRRKLDGPGSFTIPDLMALAIRFGVDVIPRYVERVELFPEAVRSRLHWIDVATGSRVTIGNDTIGAIADLPWPAVVEMAALRLIEDGELPRRLATRSDLRRHVLVALASNGLSLARCFVPTNPLVDIEIDAGPAGAIACFLGPDSVRSAGGIEASLETLVAMTEAVSDTGPIAVVVAVLPAELAAAAAQRFDINEWANGTRLRIGAGGTGSASLVGYASVGNDVALAISAEPGPSHVAV